MAPTLEVHLLTHRVAAALTTVAIIPVFATPLLAQTRIEVGPLLAVYAPTSDFQQAPYYSTALPNSPSDLTGVAWGGQGRIWLRRHFGVELQIAWASSTVGGGNTPAGHAPATPARVLTTSAQALFGFSPPSLNAELWFSAGAGLVRHGGKAYAPYGSPVQFATALGFGSSIPLRSHVSVSLGVTALLYNIDVSDSLGTSLEHGFQVDPLIHIGLSLRSP